MKKLKEYLKKQEEKMQDLEYVTKLYKRAQNEILLLFFLLLAVGGFSYNYSLFKIKTAAEYIYTDTLEKMSQKNLDKPFSLRDFDALTISLYAEKLQKEDKYFQLFKRGEFSDELEFMEMLGSDTSVTYDGSKAEIKFTVFTPTAYRIIKNNLSKLKNCDSITIDLRGNTGGMINTAENIASLFLDKGDIIYSYETKHRHKTVKCRTAAELKPKEIIILQDEWTASASELLIMALKENLGNVTIKGTQSYGKGIGQNEYPLLDGYAFKFTAEKLYTPSGSSINGTGITPDIISEEEKDDK